VNEAPYTYRRRRAAAGAVLALLLVAVVIGARSCGGTEDGAQALAPRPARLHAQLPGGGRTIFPARRVVGFYGAPQSARLGQLGIGTPDEAAARLRRAAKPFELKARPVLLAFELISTIATEAAGADNLHRMQQSDATIERYLLAARKAKALFLLDIQPGRGDFLSEVQRLERWLLEPEVGLALDPEWHVSADQIPGKTIGSVTAEQVNEVSAYLSNLTTKHDLPEKLFVIHQFTHDMIVGRERLVARPGLALTMNVDGFGNPPNKISKYVQFTADEPRFNDGFKLFYEEDTDIMSPRAVLGLAPPPDLVVYE
jgi:hypothetical protein